MKVILTGATGLIGGATLRALLASPSITKVVALARRSPEINDPKLQVVIIKDFLNYDAAVLEELKGTEACVWALGTPTGGKEVHMDFTKAGTDALLKSLDVPEGRKFTYVYVSGGLVEPDQNKTLLFLGSTRKMRGLVEEQVLSIEKSHPEQWRSFIARPGLVTKGGFVDTLLKVGTNFYIPVNELGAALADIAITGTSEKQRLENADLKERGKKVLRVAAK